MSRDPKLKRTNIGRLLIEWATVLLALSFYAAVITFAFSDEDSIREWLRLVLP